MTKWQKISFGEIKTGDFVKYVVTSDNKKTTVKGEIGNYDSSDGSWAIGGGEWAYGPQYSTECGEKAKYFRKVKPFAWPTKLGAVVTGKSDEGTITAVLTYSPAIPEAENVWWTAEWGVVRAEELSGLEELTVVSEGVTVEA